MLSILIPQGLIIISSSLLLARWVDIRSLKIICLYGLLIEVFFVLTTSAFLNSSGTTTTILVNSSFFLNIDLATNVVFIFDDISCFFSGILLTALVLCFSFLSEYFEYDAGSVSIVVLSSLFSQLAFWFFCTYDLISLIIFWEWISIVSFYLIQHWSFRVNTIKAGIKVFTVSQVGDFFF